MAQPSERLQDAVKTAPVSSCFQSEQGNLKAVRQESDRFLLLPLITF